MEGISEEETDQLGDAATLPLWLGESVHVRDRLRLIVLVTDSEGVQLAEGADEDVTLPDTITEALALLEIEGVRLAVVELLPVFDDEMLLETDVLPVFTELPDFDCESEPLVDGVIDIDELMEILAARDAEIVGVWLVDAVIERLWLDVDVPDAL